LKIRAVNDAFRTLTGLGTEEMERRSLPDLALVLWALDEPFRSHLESLRASLDTGGEFQFEHRMPGDSSRIFSFRGRVLKPDGEMFILVTMEDMTAHREMERLHGLEEERLAGEVALAARELGRTQDELRALAGSLFTSQEEERRRVARELHDDICQKLTVLAIDAHQIGNRIGSEPDEAVREMDRVRTAIGSLSEEVRRISHALHPAAIDVLGVASALQSLVDDFRAREQMIVTFSPQHVPENVPHRIATGLYRIAQEALRNVAKHAGKTHVKVTLRGGSTSLRLRIVDFGHGFDSQARRMGLGLISMEERARMMEGSFTVESKVGDGTKITVDVPLPTSP
jgi:two-component system CheB/CheR fusion protein